MTDASPKLPDIQDPLPESSWFWRRVFCFLVVAVLLFFVWGAVDRLGKVAILAPDRGIPGLVSVTKSILFLAMLTITYYLLAPSAEQLTKLVKTASLLKSGVQIASKSLVRTPGSRVETASTVGIAPAPPIPTVGTDAGVAEQPIDAKPEVTSDRKKETEILE
jgi:hypothetical protein